jgi:hypothetical protein
MKLERDGIMELEAGGSLPVEFAASPEPGGAVSLDRLTVGRHGGGRYGDWSHFDGYRDNGLVSFGRSRASE